jgi:hypothetical protein
VTNGCIGGSFSWRILKKQLTGPVRLSDVLHQLISIADGTAALESEPGFAPVVLCGAYIATVVVTGFCWQPDPGRLSTFFATSKG